MNVDFFFFFANVKDQKLSHALIFHFIFLHHSTTREKDRKENKSRYKERW